MSDDLTARREAEALAVWQAEGKPPAGICPHCGARISVVHRDERFYARCSHRGCGARGPQHYRLTSAVEAFCRPPAYVARHMAVHPSSLTDVVTMLEAERDHWRSRSERAERILSELGEALGGPFTAPDEEAPSPCACSSAYREMDPGIHAQYCALAGLPLDDGRARWRCMACDTVSTVERCLGCGAEGVRA